MQGSGHSSQSRKNNVDVYYLKSESSNYKYKLEKIG